VESQALLNSNCFGDSGNLVKRRIRAKPNSGQHSKLAISKLRAKSGHTVFHGQPVHQPKLSDAINSRSSRSGSTLGIDFDVKSDWKSRLYLLR
jgi:hypothetical protein